MENFKFSVIIPVYNGEEVIRKALESVQNQTFRDYEIIVINDGSTDQTAQVVSDFFETNKDLEQKFINCNDNNGVAHARNIGVKVSRSEYISFLDADDIWYQQKLERAYQVLKEKKGIDLICHSAYIKKEGKTIGKLEIFKGNVNFYEHLLFHSNCICTSTTVIRKESMKKVGLFSEELYAGEDYDYWLRMAMNKDCKFFFISECLGEYIISPQSVCSNLKEVTSLFRSIVRRHYFQNYKTHTLKTRLLLYLRESEILYEAAINAYYRDCWKQCMKYLLKCLIRNPWTIRGYIRFAITLFKLIIFQFRKIRFSFLKSSLS